MYAQDGSARLWSQVVGQDKLVVDLEGNAENCRREIDPVTGNEVIRCPIKEW